MKELSVQEMESGIEELIRDPKRMCFAWLPEIAVRTATNFLDATSDIEKVLQYLTGLFEIYRASVCPSPFAPHCKRELSFEWPEPVEFSWKNIEKVIEMGESAKRDRQDEFYTKFKYKIEKSSQVKALVQSYWQNASLECYANPISNLSDKLSEDEITSYDAIEELKSVIITLKTGFVSWDVLPL